MTVDEQQLAELFRDAVRDVPPSSFDERDVATAAHRVTVRRRAMLTGGSTLAVIVLAAIGVMAGLGTFGHTGGSSSTIAAGPQGQANHRSFNPHNNAGNASPRDLSGLPPLQGGGPSGRAGPDTGSALGGCGSTDDELAAALAGELSSVGENPAQTSPATVALTCPAGTRAAGYTVRNGSATGTISVLLLTSGYPSSALHAPAGSAAGTAPTKAGKEIAVVSEPASGSPSAPYGDSVDTIAHQLAPRY